MKENNKPIGIFDSGLGGLTVLKELKQEMPRESFIYFGDIQHLPYGNKSKKAIKNYSMRIGQFLISKNIKSLVIACNTASAVAFNKLNQAFSIPVFNVIDPCITHALNTTKNKKISVIGTETTINTKTYQQKIKIHNAKIQVLAKACPLFVPIVEENLIKEDFTKKIVEYYLKPLQKTKIDTLILGCTHYPLLLNIIKEGVDSNINIISSSTTTAQHIKKQLIKNNLIADKKKQSNDIFYVSDKPEKFNYLAKMFLNNKFINVNKIILE